MPDAIDPIQPLHATLHRRKLIGAATLFAVGAWSFWPIPPHESTSAVAARSPKPQALTRVTWRAPGTARAAPIDPKVFEAQLWKVPETIEQVAEAPPPPAPPPPAPMKLQLVGIVHETDQTPGKTLDRILKAALFDPETNKVYTVATGATVQRFRVKSVNADAIELVDAQSTGAPVHALRMRSNDLKRLVLQRPIAKPKGEAHQPPSPAGRQEQTPSAAAFTTAEPDPADGGRP